MDSYVNCCFDRLCNIELKLKSHIRALTAKYQRYGLKLRKVCAEIQISRGGKQYN